MLSLILCSRNDEYMGNSRWRLQTTLNYVADQIAAIDHAADIEVIVADWGSEVPLSEVVQLTPQAAAIVSFLHVPPEIARPLQKDSPFPEVLALNAAARRARGVYIGRIDQDTLVGRTFLQVFFDLHEGKCLLEVPLDRALLYANRRAIPYWFAVRCPPYPDVARFLDLFAKRTAVTRLPHRDYWTYYVGIWLTHRDVWTECGGYDERFIYYNWMEVEMIMRLRQRYTLVDFGQVVDNDFYHLEHLSPRAFTKRRDLGLPANVFDERPSAPLPYHPNSDAWGLAEFDLRLSRSQQANFSPEISSGNVPFIALVAHTAIQATVDTVYLSLVRAKALWTRRAERIRQEMRGEPASRWPRLLANRWLAWRRRA